MKKIRNALEGEVLQWSNISIKKMFGCPCYQVGGNLFAFLVNEGIILTKLNEKQKEELSAKFDAAPFQARKKTVNKWVKLSLQSKDALSDVYPYLRQSYENARNYS